jgi:hypothetical protein
MKDVYSRREDSMSEVCNGRGLRKYKEELECQVVTEQGAFVG